MPKAPEVRAPARSRRWPVFLVLAAFVVYAMWVVAWFANGHLPGDAFTYLAAGQRLNAGHAIYSLTTGDSPVLMPPNYPPYPLFSPPLIAVVFRPLAALPGDFGAWLWWACAAVTVVAVVAVALAGRPVAGALLVLALSFSLGVLTGVGNVDAFLLAGAFALYGLMGTTDRPPRSAAIAAGAIVGVLISVKLIPLALAWWLLATRRSSALAVATVVVIACAVVVVVGAYPGAFIEYLSVVRSASGASPGAASFAGLTRLVGVPAGLSAIVQYAFIAGALVAIVLLVRRGRRDAAFSVACLTMALGSPAAAAHTPALLLAAIAPYSIDGLRELRSPRTAPAAVRPPLAASPPVAAPEALDRG